MSENGLILKNLFINYSILQLILIVVWIYLGFSVKKVKSRLGIFFVSLNFLIYLIVNFHFVKDLIHNPDLKIGGVGFAFEMITLIYCAAHTIGLLIVIGLYNLIRKNFSLK